MDGNGNYKIRYLVEPWGKPPGETSQFRPGTRKSDDNYGYADDIFLASILRDETGKVISILLLDSVNGPAPSREMLEMIRKQIEYHLEKHV